MFKARKTVDSVIANFRQAVTDLYAIDEEKRLEAARIGGKIEELVVDRADAVDEADRARSIAGKIEALIS